MVAASIFNKALVDVFAFELAFVQSGIGETFLQAMLVLMFYVLIMFGNVHVVCFDIS